MNDDGEETYAGGIGTAGEDAPTQQLGLTAVGDRCVACGAPLSSDQRYCVNCGERRNKPRFSLPEAAPAPEVATTARRPSRRPRTSSGGTLVAGVGTLLLAMGVGVLIGHTNTSSAARTSSPKDQIVYLNGSSPNSTAAASTPSSKTGKKSGSKSKSKSNSPTGKKATAAASKVLGGKNLPPSTVTVGQSGHGPGYQHGHFTGTFFGGG
jgi:hypothetical protein